MATGERGKSVSNRELMEAVNALKKEVNDLKKELHEMSAAMTENVEEVYRLLNALATKLDVVIENTKKTSTEEPLGK
jgi:hypothetical protein